MSDTSPEKISVPYVEALRGFLSGTGEEALASAYKIGRTAVEDGLGCLDLLKVHEESLHQLLIEQAFTEPIPEIVRKASHFFAESLSTFEMTHRGFQESIETLKVRADELAAINSKLAGEIEERNQVELALRESEAQYRTLVDTARDVIYTLSPEGLITSLNPAFEDMLGWLRDEWIGKHFAPLVHPDDMPQTMEMFQRILRGEYPNSFEIRILSRRGTYLITEFVKAPRFRDGKVVGVLGIGRDITKRRQAEEELKKNEQQLATAQQIAHVGSWEWDMQSDVVRWSDELYRIFGIEQSAFGGSYKDYLELIHPDDQALANQVIQSALNSGKTFTFEHRVILRDQSIRDIEGRGEIIRDALGKPTMMLGTAQDITERKKVNHALQSLARRVVDAQEEERKRISRELHDNICQRLSAMKLHMQVLQDKVRNSRSPLSRDLAGLRRQIGTSIKEIRSISANLRPSTLDDLGLANALHLLCREFQKTTGLKIEFGADGFEQNMIPSHSETAVYRLTQEALANVAKHAHAKEVLVQLRRTGSSVLLSIRDDGKGFDTGKIASRTDGTGMGLFNMRERAQLAGATLVITSAKNRGTTLRLEIPITEQVMHEAHQDPPRR